MNGRRIMLVWALVVSSASAAITGADDPKAFTTKDWYRGYFDFLQQVSSKAYLAVGHHDPKWDEPATKFLDDYVRRSTYPEFDHRFASGDEPTVEQLEREGQAAVDAGCDDPLALDCFGATLVRRGNTKQGVPMLRDAAAALLESKYAPVRVALSLKRTGQILTAREDQELKNQVENQYFDLTVAIACQPNLKTNDRRYLSNEIEVDLNSWPIEKVESLLEAIDKQKSCDPWLRDMIAGRLHIRKAWTARGNGFADGVTQEGWKGFADNLQKARECLTRAWQLEPNLPYAPASMIEVSMGDPQPMETERLWFDRTIKAQLDYIAAYRSLRWALRPRWSGSHEAMIAFGLECAASKRYDTAIPYVLIDVLNDVRSETLNWDCYGDNFDRVAEVLRAYAEFPGTPDYREMHYCHLAGVAWQVGKYKDGADAMAEIDNHVNKMGFGMAESVPGRSAAAVCAMGGSHAAEISAAEHLARKQPFDAALAAYAALQKTIAADDGANDWIRNRIQELTWLKKFENGEWVDLTPDAALDGWSVLDGNWRVGDDGKLNCTTDDGACIICNAPFRGRYEYNVTIEYGEMNPRANPNAGPWFGYLGLQNYVSLSINPISNDLYYHYGDDPPRRSSGHIKPGPQDYHVAMWDGEAGATIHGHQSILRFAQQWPFAAARQARVGIGTCRAGAGTNFRCTKIEIRKLDQRPVEKNS